MLLNPIFLKVVDLLTCQIKWNCLTFLLSWVPELCLCWRELVEKRKSCVVFRSHMHRLPVYFSTYTSQGIKYNRNAMDVNVRSIYAMSCGVRHQGLQKFCGIMNMPPPVAYISSKVGEAVEMAIASMIQAAVEIKEKEGKVI